MVWDVTIKYFAIHTNYTTNIIQANHMTPIQEEGRSGVHMDSWETRCNKLVSEYNFDNPTGEHMPIRSPSCTCGNNWPRAVCSTASSWSPAQEGSCRATYSLDFLPTFKCQYRPRATFWKKYNECDYFFLIGKHTPGWNFTFTSILDVHRIVMFTCFCVSI